jgi:hypothetical protein
LALCFTHFKLLSLHCNSHRTDGVPITDPRALAKIRAMLVLANDPRADLVCSSQQAVSVVDGGRLKASRVRGKTQSIRVNFVSPGSPQAQTQTHTQAQHGASAALTPTAASSPSPSLLQDNDQLASEGDADLDALASRLPSNQQTSSPPKPSAAKPRGLPAFRITAPSIWSRRSAPASPALSSSSSSSSSSTASSPGSGIANAFSRHEHAGMSSHHLPVMFRRTEERVAPPPTAAPTRGMIRGEQLFVQHGRLLYHHN